MTIDISKIRPGDKVTLVPLEVRSVQPGAIRIWFPRFGDVAFAADIAAHHPAPREFQVGNRVRAPDGGVGTVRGVDGEEVWVRWPNAISNWGAAASDLTLVEDGE